MLGWRGLPLMRPFSKLRVCLRACAARETRMPLDSFDSSMSCRPPESSSTPVKSDKLAPSLQNSQGGCVANLHVSGVQATHLMNP